MNKKILSLAFVSAAMLFGCSAEGSFTASKSSPPEDWDLTPGGPSKYCSFFEENEEKSGIICVQITDKLTESKCTRNGGTVITNTSECDDIEGKQNGGHDDDDDGGYDWSDYL